MERMIHEDKGRLYMGEKQDPAAELVFDVEDDTMIILSTHVDPDEREQGLGRELVDEAVNYARKHKLMIDPVCSFAHNVIEETPEYQVVRKK
ncbi:GNAT family N-acetyltransferase [Halobacillus kuroshimensis]|uniref:GNAT family N-acetyltransferase n=1 Tax=Halobacillus kuroshimensis TaxID=302481 RepID=UPI0004868311|nr:GNAT family N-acetyltransferase [Halobacillus kuroshimensis]